ncbi:MAG: Hsp33 family molecular chaperone HslO [Clostridiales bacterium]|nr:Hsp33 family molecular chaperone HslO [Clostridiales bacterium]
MDTIVHFTLQGGAVRGLLIDATETAREAQKLQGSSAVAAAALGRGLTAAAMLASMLKDQKSTVTLTIDGDGPLKKIVCVGGLSGGADVAVRGYVQNHAVQLPLKDGKLDIGGGVGRHGRLSVVKDLRLKTPYIGQVKLISGEIAADLAYYYVQSEQTPSLVSLGVIASDVGVSSAGGVLLQAMPGCDDAMIDKLELMSPIFGDIANELLHDSIEALLERWFAGLEAERLETRELRYECGCSRARMERALIALGEEELKSMITDDVDGAELVCHFCSKKYQFTTQDLLRLLNRRH